MTDLDEQFMAEALKLAGLGRGCVEPNPMVGAMLVRDGSVLGQGYHRALGGPHAEVEAIRSARSGGHDVRGATLYVSLEPCCHTGRTPPCTDAILEAGLARVVGAMQDVDPRVAGKGYQILRDAGLEVRDGVLAQQARELLGAYIKLRTRGRPWVICKWAQTPGGLLALPARAGRWVSCPASLEYSHHLRSICDGICIGIGTLLSDDPLLTNRKGSGRQPVRIVLDSRLQTPPGCQLVRTAREHPALIATTSVALEAQSAKARELRQAGVELLELPAGEGGLDLGAMLDELGRRQHTYLMVEGGPAVLGSFVYGGLADELLAFVCPAHVSYDLAGDAMPRFDIAQVAAKLNLDAPRKQAFGPDLLWRYVLTK